jgi:hypothetical protein
MEEMYIFLSKAKDTQRILKRCGFAGCTGSGLFIPAPRRQRSGRSQFMASTGKKLVRLHLNKNNLGVVVHACYLSYLGDIGRKTVVPGQQGKQNKAK